MNRKATAIRRRTHIGFTCPQCKAGAAVMHTYRKPCGTQRRHQCPQGHRFTTMERLYANYAE